MVIILLIIAIAIVVQTKPVQNWLVGIATKTISKQLGTAVSIKSVDFGLFNKANINGLFVADKSKDTIFYAGNLNLSITDWFFLKDKAELKKIGLEDAVIKLSRTDTVWNYQYIVNHFASTDAATTKSKTTYLLNEIDFKNSRFIKKDGWRGETITANIANLFIKIDSLNFNNNHLFFNKIQAVEPQVDIQKYKGNRPENYVVAAVTTSNPTNPLLFIVTNFSLKNAALGINNEYKKPIASFDGDHILFNKLNATFNKFKISADTLSTVLNLSTEERSGLQIKKLKANIKWVPGMMELSKLDLVTNKSRLTNYYAMRFNNFDDDFAAYETNVVMDAHFVNSYINSDDIAYFSPSLKNWKKELQITGNWLGTVANFKIENLIAKEKNNETTIAGNLSMKGLPNINNTIIGFNNGNIKTNYKDLSAIIPSLKNISIPNIAALGTMLFKGNFNGTTTKFITNGIIETALGNIESNVAMEFPKNKEAVYSGDLTLSNFNLARFVNEDQLGIVDFKGKFDGSSFNLQHLNTKLEGHFNSFTYNGYTYKNITTKGKFLNKYFNGELKVDDPNFHLNGQAEANFSKAQPSFNILGDITKSNLQTLNLSKDELHLTGLLDVNFTGTNIDNFLGAAKFLNAKISNGKSAINFDSLTLSTEYINGSKSLHFASNDFNIDVNGEFKILDLPVSFQSFLHNYYPAYITAPATIPQNQKFVVNLTTRYVEPYIQLFNKDIKGFNDVNLIGSIDTKNNAFGMTLLLPYGKYKNYIITGAEINGKGNRDSLFMNGLISNFQVGDSLSFPNSNLTIVSSNNISDIKLKTRATNTLNEADLNVILETSTQGLKINFNPSSFILNDKKWNLDNEGEIVLYKNYTAAKNVKFVQGFQEISIETAPVEDGNTNSLDVKLKEVVVGDLASLISKKTSIEGIANGTIHVDDIFGKLIASTNIKISELKVDEDSIGTAFIKGIYSSKTGKLDYDFSSPNQQYNLNASGFFNFKDTNAIPLNTTINLQNSKIDIVQKLIGTSVFSNLSGYATGKLNISGKPSALNLLGKIKLQNAAMKVNFTQVYYTIDSANISFENDGIDFGEFNIKDSIGNIGLVKGKLYEQNFKKMFFDFDVSSNKLLLLNTKMIDNDKFYGNLTGKAFINFYGPEDNCKMIISGEPTSASHITIPNTNSKETSDASFIVFKPIGEEMVEAKKQSNFNLLVDLDVTANNFVDFDVVLDQTSGDVISTKGNGRLRVKVGTNDKLDMRGKLNIDEGNYNFNFQSLIRKPFVLRKGDNNFIEWNGDPYDAYMHVDAMYEAKNISVKDLIGSNTSFSNASKTFRDDVYVIANLSGKLMKPDIKFRFDFPANSPIKNDDVFERFRKKIEGDDNEMLKQVAYLIVFNSFAPYGEQSIAQTNFASIGVNTISALVTKEVNKALTNLLYKITKDKSLIFDISSSVYSSTDLFSQGQGSINATSTPFDRYNVKVKVGKSFMNDKLRFNVGSDLDINLRSAAQAGNFQWLPDWNVQWILNDEKSLSLVVFSKNSLDISGSTLGKRTRQGVGITYKKDFEKSPFEKIVFK